MPVYNFNIRLRDRLFPDPEGEEVASEEEARRRALETRPRPHENLVLGDPGLARLHGRGDGRERADRDDRALRGRPRRRLTPAREAGACRDSSR